MSDYNGPERRSSVRARNGLLWFALALLTLLAGLALYGAFVVGPDERNKIRDTADKADTIATTLAKSNAGVTGLICTGSNRHDAVDEKIAEAILPGTRIFDQQNGTDLTGPLKDALKQIPPATNCGELICQFFREIDSPEAEITIDDPFGPDRKLAPCGPDPEVDG